MNIAITIIGKLFDICNNINAQYQLNKVKKECSFIGKGSYIPWPCTVKSSNSFSSSSEKNIYIGNNVSFGPGLIMYAIRAKITVKDNSFSGPNLTIMTGDHPYEFVGKFIKDNKKNQMEKEGIDVSKYDQDVVIEEDVWIGSNVTILKGVTIGRGCIISAGSLVTKNTPPYSIIGGVPAKVLKYRFTPEEIILHEEKLYKKGDRLTCQILQDSRSL